MDAEDELGASANTTGRRMARNDGEAGYVSAGRGGHKRRCAGLSSSSQSFHVLFPSSSSSHPTTTHSHSTSLPTPTNQSPSTSLAEINTDGNANSPLLTLPPELLELVALHLATRPPNLGPPATLLPLLATCRAFLTRLGWGRNWGLWARIARCKFSFADDGTGYVPYAGYPWAVPDPDGNDLDLDGMKRTTQTHAAYALRTRTLALRTIRAGDVHVPGAARALQVAYGMLLEDRWEGARMDWTQLDVALGRASAVSGVGNDDGDADDWRTRGKGKNRRQLLWADAREFAMCYVRERLYEGRFGERDAALEASSHPHESRPEGHTLAWRAGWPRDAEGAAAALWVLWFFEGVETLTAEPEPLRRHIMSLLLPLVVAPFRYTSSLAPAHHYTVPLLPAVFASAALDAQLAGEGEAGRRAITVPTHHGAFPIYPLGAPFAPPSATQAGRRQDSPTAAARLHHDSPPTARTRRGSSARPSRRARPARSRSLSRSRAENRSRSRSHSQARRARLSPPGLSRSSPGLQACPPARPPARPQAFIPTHPHAGSRARLLAAPPARLLFFARMQTGMRMGVPPHLPRDRAEAAARWAADGGLGPQPIRPTQEDIHEKNARPLVRFEGQLPTLGSSSTSASTSATATLTSTASMGITGTTSAGATSTAATSAGTAAAAIDALLAVDPGLDLDHHESTEEDGRDDRWATHRWRARFCTGYAPRPLSRASTLSPAGVRRGAAAARLGGEGGGGAPPGRTGRVYELGSFAGLWSGTMLMPSEPPYTALVAAPGGAFPPGGLARDDFVAAARPVYMRIREHWSFHPDHPAPPPAPDTTTADEGMHNGWLPPGTRVDGVGGGCVDVRVPTAAAEWRRGDEERYRYHTLLDARAPAGAHAAHETDGCPGCVRRRERERWARGRALGGDDRWEGEMWEEGSYESPSSEAGSRGSSISPSDSTSSRSSQERPSSNEDSQATSSSAESSPSSKSQHSDSSSWAEWDAPAWAAHRFDDDEGWEGICDGVQDVTFTGETDPRHGMAWHHYEYTGRVRPWDGLIGLVMRPRDRTLGLATYFISGHLAGRDTFQGTWQMAGQDVLVPSWGGSVCLARGED
ncbi:hypothetical protein DFH06DRAFT_58980 [Mycena polygramma]|nr:hypothetical protein DFH06DRAFT_58980 [Mycena polygramma]